MAAVLSVVGTILLVLLKIVLILLLLVGFLLFCPVCYKGKADYHGTLSLEGRALWLCGLIYLSFAAGDDGRRACIRLFGVDVSRFFEKNSGRRGKKAEGNQKHKKNTASSSGDGASGHEKDKNGGGSGDGASNHEKNGVGGSSGQGELHIASIEEADENDNTTKVEKDTAIRQTVSQDKQKQTFFERLRQKVSDFIWSIKQFFHSICFICGKIRRKCEWAGDAKIFWQSENTQRMVCILKDNVLHLWRKLKPKVFRGSIVFGTGDPCTTGQALGAAAFLYAYYGKGIQVMPDFEEKRFEGNLLVKGRVSFITILIILVRIFMNGEWGRFRREAEQLKEAL